MNLNHAMPKLSVRTVSGTPTLEYSQKETLTPSRRALSTTIRLATEPRTVRFPANVLDIASASQAVSWLAGGTTFRTGPIQSTARTLPTRFGKAAETRR